MTGVPTSRATGSAAGEQAGLLEPARLVRVVGWGSVVGGLFTWLTVLAPHQDHVWDLAYVTIGVFLVAFGAALVAVARRHALSRVVVHASTLVLACVALALTWFGMRDLGGIQVILLVVVLSICALTGPTWWTLLFSALLSAGYAVVLVTAVDVLGFDKASQWQVVTVSLLVTAGFVGMVRSELERSRWAERARQAERNRERELHAERLEHLNESLQEASELKSSFVAMASHELRTPLTSIEGFASTMQHRWNELSDDEKRRFVDVIDTQAQRLGRLVADLLTVSRIEAGRVEARPVATDLHRALTHALESWSANGGNTYGEPTRLRFPDECPPAIVDPDHLQQMLLNYLSNAYAYGEPPIEVVAEVEADRRHVRIDVVDAGTGVEPEFVPELFDRFARAPTTPRHDESPGTGLGLSIVRGLAEANDGEAWYEPGSPTGARFCLRLPLAT